MKIGLFYCVAVPGTPTTRTSPYVKPTPPPSTPLPSSCADTWFVGARDTCISIAEKVDISLAKLIAWNPQLGASDEFDCNVTPGSRICVRKPSGQAGTDIFGTTTAADLSSSGTASDAPTETSRSERLSTSASVVPTPSPVQDGMVSGCTRLPSF